MTNVVHSGLADARWEELSLLEQMGNIGSEVSHALSARERGRPTRAEIAAAYGKSRDRFSDFFFGDNVYGSTADSWRAYFLAFAVAARRDR